MFHHHFDIGLATKYGIDQAIVLSYIWQNIKRNIANKSQCYDNQYWSKDTKTGLAELFPYCTELKIETIFSKLSENDLIVYKDSTKVAGEIWYTLTAPALDYFTKGTQITRKTKTKKTINKEKFSEIKDFELYTKSEDRIYFIIAYKFWKLWNTENPNSYTLKNSEVSKWTNALKMIVEKDKQDLKRLIGVYVYFQKCAKNEAGYERFWFENIQSVTAFRKKNKDDAYYLDNIIIKVNKKIEQSDTLYNEILKAEKELLS